LIAAEVAKQDKEEKDQVLVELIVEKYVLEIPKGNQADLIHQL